MGTTWSQDHKETVVWMQPGKNYYDNTCAQKKQTRWDIAQRNKHTLNTQTILLHAGIKKFRDAK